MVLPRSWHLLLWASPHTERPRCLASAATALHLLLPPHMRIPQNTNPSPPFVEGPGGGLTFDFCLSTSTRFDNRHIRSCLASRRSVEVCLLCGSSQSAFVLCAVILTRATPSLPCPSQPASQPVSQPVSQPLPAAWRTVGFYPTRFSDCPWGCPQKRGPTFGGNST